MNLGGAPKPKPVGPSKEVEINKKASSLARADLEKGKKKGLLATALAGETGGYGGSGFGGSTALS